MTTAHVCECCWREASERVRVTGNSVTEHYLGVRTKHRTYRCVCTQNTEEGRKVRTGEDGGIKGCEQLNDEHENEDNEYYAEEEST